MQPGRCVAPCPGDLGAAPSSFGHADCNYLTNRDTNRNTPFGACDGNSYRRAYSQPEGAASRWECTASLWDACTNYTTTR